MLFLLFGVASAQWWTTGLPENYQCALRFVPSSILQDASAYSQLFLNSLTAQSPEFWGSAYGGESYSSVCSTDLTTTLTRTLDVTVTTEPSTGATAATASAASTTRTTSPAVAPPSSASDTASVTPAPPVATTTAPRMVCILIE